MVCAYRGKAGTLTAVEPLALGGYIAGHRREDLRSQTECPLVEATTPTAFLERMCRLSPCLHGEYGGYDETVAKRSMASRR